LSKKDKEKDDDLEGLDEDLEDLFKDADKGAKAPKPPAGPAGPAAPLPPEGEFSEEAMMEEPEEEEEEKEPYDPRPLILKIRSQEANRVEFEIAKQSHGFCNLLRRILLNDDRVMLAAYKVDYFNPPRFMVELHDIKQFKTVLLDATKRIKEDLQELEKGLAKL
jgi:DNA-directed RNA polymerase subunit L